MALLRSAALRWVVPRLLQPLPWKDATLRLVVVLYSAALRLLVPGLVAALRSAAVRLLVVVLWRFRQLQQDAARLMAFYPAALRLVVVLCSAAL